MIGFNFVMVYCMQDPEFYEFLKEHDKELLDFDEEDLDVSEEILLLSDM